MNSRTRDFHANVFYDAEADQMENGWLKRIKKKPKILVFFIIINNASLLKTWICLHFITFFPSQVQLDSSGQGHHH